MSNIQHQVHINMHIHTYHVIIVIFYTSNTHTHITDLLKHTILILQATHMISIIIYITILPSM